MPSWLRNTSRSNSVEITVFSDFDGDAIFSVLHEEEEEDGSGHRHNAAVPVGSHAKARTGTLALAVGTS